MSPPPKHRTTTPCGGQGVASAPMQEADLIEVTNTGAPPALQPPILPLPEEQEMEVDTELTAEGDELLDETVGDEATDQETEASGASSPEVQPGESETLPSDGGETPSAGVTEGMSGLSVASSQAREARETSEGMVEATTLPANDSTASPKVE